MYLSYKVTFHDYPPIAISQKPFWKAPSRPIFAPEDICTTPLAVN